MSYRHSPISPLRVRRRPRLPIEIWEHVIDFIDVLTPRRFNSLRLRTLVSCCLTCRAWLPRARFHLFHAIPLRLLPGKQNVTRFLDGLRFNPSNSTLIRWMMFDGAAAESRRGAGLSLIACQFPAPLPNLRSITFAGVDIRHLPKQFYRFLPQFDNAQLLVLEASFFSSHDQIYRVLKPFKNLVTLTVQTKELLSFPINEFDGLQHHRISVPSLTLRIQSSAIEAINLFTPCTILTLELEDYPEHSMHRVTDYLQFCGEALKRVTLTFNCNPNAQQQSLSSGERHSFYPSAFILVMCTLNLGFVNFSANTNLTHINLNLIPIRAQAEAASSDVLAIGASLSTISSRRLEVLKLHMMYLWHRLESLPLTSWETIDEPFTSLVFSNVKQIHVGITTFATTEPHWQELAEQSLVNLFPKLASKRAACFAPFWPGKNR